MSALNLQLDCELTDGTRFSVVTTTRDIAKLEAHTNSPDAFERMPVTSMRYMAWTAATRQGLTALLWEEFDEQLEDAMPPDEEDEKEGADADDEGLDPGQPVAPASPSSRSAKRRASTSSARRRTGQTGT
jgi:hypothetical protein